MLCNAGLDLSEIHADFVTLIKLIYCYINVVEYKFFDARWKSLCWRQILIGKNTIKMLEHETLQKWLANWF